MGKILSILMLCIGVDAHAMLLYKSHPFKYDRNITVQTTMINNKFYVTTASDKRFKTSILKTKTCMSYSDVKAMHHHVLDWVVNRYMHTIEEEESAPKKKSPRRSITPPLSPKKKKKMIVIDEIDLTDPEPVASEGQRDVAHEQIIRDVDAAWEVHENVRLLEEKAQLEAELE